MAVSNSLLFVVIILSVHTHSLTLTHTLTLSLSHSLNKPLKHGTGAIRRHTTIKARSRASSASRQAVTPHTWPCSRARFEESSHVEKSFY
jgi:hypothetical protein